MEKGAPPDESIVAFRLLAEPIAVHLLTLGGRAANLQPLITEVADQIAATRLRSMLFDGEDNDPEGAAGLKPISVFDRRIAALVLEPADAGRTAPARAS